jgi:phage terminase Nu1 subunit (DNA packaging protein)
MGMQARLWNLSGLATELGRDKRGLARDLEGLAPDEVEQYGGKESAQWRMRRVVNHLLEKVRGAAGNLDLDEQRAQLAFEQAEAARMRNEAARGETLEVAGLETALEQVFVAFKNQLISAPSRLAPELNPEKPAVARSILSREVTRILTDLQDGFIEAGRRDVRRDDRPARRVDTDAGAGDNGNRVGGQV